MPNRYVTKAEIEGARRRHRAYLERKAAAGIKGRSMMLTDPEDGRVRQIVHVWRGEGHSLTEPLTVAAAVLAPEQVEQAQPAAAPLV